MKLKKQIAIILSLSLILTNLSISFSQDNNNTKISTSSVLISENEDIVSNESNDNIEEPESDEIQNDQFVEKNLNGSDLLDIEDISTDSNIDSFDEIEPNEPESLDEENVSTDSNIDSFDEIEPSEPELLDEENISTNSNIDSFDEDDSSELTSFDEENISTNSNVDTYDEIFSNTTENNATDSNLYFESTAIPTIDNSISIQSASESDIYTLIASASDTHTFVASASDIVLFSTNPTAATSSEIATTSNVTNTTFKNGFIAPKTKVPRAKRFSKDDLFGAETLPSSYDARTIINENGLSIVPPVRDQGNYGTCWAHSVIGAIETSIRKKNLVATEEESNLSELALSYFTLEGLKDVTKAGSTNIDKPGIEGHDWTAINGNSIIYSLGEDNFADGGGNQIEAVLVATSHMGAIVENDETAYSNENVARVLNEGLDGKYAFNNNSFEIKNVQMLNKDDIDLIKKAIMDNGSVAMNYREKRNYQNCHEHDGEWYYLSPNETADHAVMIVGWNDNVPKEHFYDSEHPSFHYTNNGAWLVRNSWGPSNNKMNAGYFWISYEDRSLDDTFYSIEAVKKDTYKYNYHYDTTACENSMNIGPRNNLKYVGNVYKVSNDEDQVLDAINFAVESSGIDVDIEVYTKNSKMSSPIDGTKILSERYQNPISGIWTVGLNKKILLKKNTYFSIIIKPREDLTLYMDWVDTDDSWYNARLYYNSSDYGESFTYTGKWFDSNTDLMEKIDGKNFGANFRIRALTNSAKTINFNANGGKGSMNAQSVVPNTTTALNKNSFDRDGFVFSHWLDADGNKYEDGAKITITDDITLNAQWTPATL